MKKAVILHAMEQNSRGHWYSWLKIKLEELGYKVWVPDLPHSDHPDTIEMTEFLLSNSEWDYSDNLVIGHSSGSVEVLYLLQALNDVTKVKTAVLVSSFDHMVKGMESQHDKVFIKEFDFEKIKTKAESFIFVHGSDDPWCPIEGAKNLADKTGGELVLVPNGGHFSTSLDLRYRQFPELIDILSKRNLL